MQSPDLTTDSYREFFESTIAGLRTPTPDVIIRTCNPAFARIFGFESVEVCLKADAASFYKHPQDRVRYLELLRRRQRLENHETEMRRPDGTSVFIAESASAVFD